MQVKIEIKNLQKKIRVFPEKIKKAVRKALVSEGKSFAAKVNVVFVTDALIKNLNKKFHHRDSATDVLAFDLGTDKDIVISTDTAKRNSRMYNTSAQYEMCLYAVHGMLHLLGHNDKTEKQRRAMQNRAEKILKDVH